MSDETPRLCRYCWREIQFSSLGDWRDTDDYLSFCLATGNLHEPDDEDEDDVFPEWDAAAELADDARKGK